MINLQFHNITVDIYWISFLCGFTCIHWWRQWRFRKSSSSQTFDLYGGIFWIFVWANGVHIHLCSDPRTWKSKNNSAGILKRPKRAHKQTVQTGFTKHSIIVDCRFNLEGFGPIKGPLEDRRGLHKVCCHLPGPSGLGPCRPHNN